MQPPPTDQELFLLRSIEWTIFTDATYETALEQTNVILRYFLGAYFPFNSFFQLTLIL
jgi:nuclear pore complex protein Nup107